MFPCHWAPVWAPGTHPSHHDGGWGWRPSDQVMGPTASCLLVGSLRWPWGVLAPWGPVASQGRETLPPHPHAEDAVSRRAAAGTGRGACAARSPVCPPVEPTRIGHVSMWHLCPGPGTRLCTGWDAPEGPAGIVGGPGARLQAERTQDMHAGLQTAAQGACMSPGWPGHSPRPDINNGTFSPGSGAGA